MPRPSRSPPLPSQRELPGGAAFAVMLAAACACGSPPPPQTVAAPVGPPQPSVVQAVPPPPDVSEVPAPPGLVVWGRLGRPSTALAAIHVLSQLPPVTPEQVTELLAGAALGPIADLDATVDVAVSVEGEGTSIRARIAAAAGARGL